MLIRRIHIPKFEAIKPPIILQEIQSNIEAIEKNSSIQEETDFNNRMETIDYIDFHIIDRIEGLLQKTSTPEELLLLKQYAEKVKVKLEKVNADLFQRLRANIQTGICTGSAFKDMVNKYVGNSLSNNQQPDEIGYSNLDIFINGLFTIQAIPLETKERDQEMVFYQKTPAKIVFELTEKANFTEEDVFYDLGSGLGQVSILVNLLSGVVSKGIEFEPAYCNYAKKCASELNLSNVEFINIDARNADYSKATVFFMYTPFKGKMLQEVLEILRKESQKREIRLFTYGPCTAHIASQNWLNCVNSNKSNIYKLCEFISTKL